MPRAQLIAGSSEIAPEGFRNIATVDLLCQHRNGLFPFRERGVAVSFFVVGDRKVIVDIGTFGGKLKRVRVFGDRAFAIPSTGVVIAKSQIT